MIGRHLHAFDEDLCDHAVGNITIHLPSTTDDLKKTRFREYAFALRAVLTDKRLLGYIFGRTNPNLDAEQVRLSLNDDELYSLELTFQDPELDRPWEPYPELYRRYLATLPDVRHGVSQGAARRWSEESEHFASRFEGRRVRLHEGIAVIREWTGRLRALLRAMGAVNLLPAPEGTSPTPTVPVPVPAVPDDPRYGGLSLAEVHAIERMRHAINRHAKGNATKSRALITAARINNQHGTKALRWLERHEGYQGFSRPLKSPPSTRP